MGRTQSLACFSDKGPTEVVSVLRGLTPAHLAQKKEPKTLKSVRIWSQPSSLGSVAWTLSLHLPQPRPHLSTGLRKWRRHC